MATEAAVAARARTLSSIQRLVVGRSELGSQDTSILSIEVSANVVSAGRHVCYRDMFVWIHNFKGLVKNRSEEELRPMNIQAFCDGALIWYSTEVGALQKDLLRDATMEWWH